MDYKNHYNMLIKRAKNRTLSVKTETHHIIPRCMGGNNNASNLAELTPEEHFLAHELLVKIYPENKSLVFAAHMMGATRQNNKVYGWLKRRYVNACTGIPKSQETKRHMSLAKQGYIPWNAGLKLGAEYSNAGSWAPGNIPWNKGEEHMVGNKNPAFGKKWDEEKRVKMSRTNSGRKRAYRADGTFYYIYPHLENKEIV